MSATAWLLAGAAFGAGVGLAYVVRRVRRMPKISLAQAVQMAADQPGQATDAVFHAALVRTPVVVLPVAADAAADADVQVKTQDGPAGEHLLLTYSGGAAAKAHEPGAKLVAVTVRDALLMVGKGGLDGLAVMNPAGAYGWVPRAEIEALLRRVPQVGVVS